MSESQQADYLASVFSPLQLRVYDLLIEGGPASRDAIVQKLQAPRTTVFDALKFLEKKGLAARRAFYHEEHVRGRPVTVWYLPGRD